MWSNFHTHSEYCDGKGPLQDYVQQAKQLNMPVLGFSSHAPLPFHCNWCMSKDQLPNYISTLEALASLNPEIEIYKGLEVDFIPDLISPTDFQNKLDYTIGSIHFVEKFDDGRHWEIDGSHLHFLDGLEKIFKNDSKQAITRYFELTREMIDNSTPAIVGHLDKIKIQNIGNKFFQESDEWYQQEVKKTLALIKKTGAIVEVNTRGIYQKKSATTYPSPWVLEEVLRQKIPVTINSDAHHPNDLTTEFETTARHLLKIGFRKLIILTQGKWAQVDFTEKEILHER